MTCGPFTVGHHTVYADAIPIAHPLKNHAVAFLKRGQAQPTCTFIWNIRII